MSGTLERIRITGLHGYKNLDVNLQDDTLILVGENGSGKTTFLRILFHFLSGRWLSLAQFRFESLVARISGSDYQVRHSELAKAFKSIDKRLLAELPTPLRHRVLELLRAGDIDRVSAELERFGARYSLPTPALLFRQLDFFEDEPRGLKRELQEKVDQVRAAVRAQVLYLPTYRRIERELGSIFEGIDPDDFKRHRNRLRQSESGDSYIELVEFGMKDVQQAVDRTLETLKEFARESLNNLTLRYLGDVVNRGYQNVGMKEIAEVSEDTVRAVLDRIHENILTRSHKEHLFNVINSARSANAPGEHEKIICHYFLKLLEFQRALQTKETQISEFCELCSQYIVDKRFVYNSPTFSVRIVPNDEDRADRTIAFGDLSSGEKQIVSLFSHLYLSGRQGFAVLIDEPELSLSVPWQRRFLTDIRSGTLCKALVAATHSPFIYDNELRKYTRALGEFIRS